MLHGVLRDHLETEQKLRVISSTPLSGGCINHALRLETDRGKFFLKWNEQTPPAMFPCEARGLALIASTQTIRVPQVVATNDPSANEIPGFILMEWIERSQQGNPNMAILGEKLAALHHTSTGRGHLFGLDHDNFLGSSPQENKISPDWPAFFRDQRLGFQVELAALNGRLPPSRRKRLDRLMENIHRFLPSREELQPSILHGDLWSENVIPDEMGVPVLVDPAVYYGDREAEIAYTELFGGFAPAFYQAYRHNFPLDPGYPDRRDLYNLYHLLNHLNLFGEMYGSEVDCVLQHYIV